MKSTYLVSWGTLHALHTDTVFFFLYILIIFSIIFHIILSQYCKQDCFVLCLCLSAQYPESYLLRVFVCVEHKAERGGAVVN